MSDVFCKNCKHVKHVLYGHNDIAHPMSFETGSCECAHPDNVRETTHYFWGAMEVARNSCAARNRKFDCEDYESKD